ncbi:MAG: PQQ-dependent sugar dehydrogenase [Candidatus Brocadiae bacterium]|nr:PQQ-dependent sugar dehydrogenase [Candidatus Brocadiia bacterium]
MLTRVSILAVLLVLSIACESRSQGIDHDALRRNPPAGGDPLPDLRLAPAWPNLRIERPVAVVEAPDGKRQLYAVSQEGTIVMLPQDSAARDAAIFLDISRRVLRDHNEEGLLSLAFHPDFAKNGQFYVWYSASGPRRHVLARFTCAKGAPKADPSSEKVLIEIPKVHGNHNGSTLLFGADGFLYFSVGDGGAANDPQKHGQNLNSWFGKIHRIDVNREEGGKPYAVPKDNPFVGRAGVRTEIWAWGLRNVWRMSFDRETGDLWAGDVGQNAWEEIDVIVKGGNYGWRVREGTRTFSRDADPGGLIGPVVEYGRDDGMSITGGHVYRGKGIPALTGAYLYADYVTGTVWAIRTEKGKLTAWKECLKQPKNIASFGEDPDGEILVCCFDGRIYRLAAR